MAAAAGTAQGNALVATSSFTKKEPAQQLDFRPALGSQATGFLAEQLQAQRTGQVLERWQP